MAPRERRGRLYDDVELNDEGFDEASATIQQSRRVRKLASVALLAAAVVTVGVVYVAVTGHHLPMANERTAVALNANEEARIAGNNKTFVAGWYHIYLNTVLRKELSTDSEVLQKIPVGSRIYLVEKRGRRVRVEQPVKGWTSIETADGVVIARPEMKWAQDKDSQSQRKVAEVDAQVASMTRLEVQLVDLMKSFNENIGNPELKSILGSKGGFQHAQKALANGLHSGIAEITNTAANAVSDTKKTAENILRDRLTLKMKDGSNLPAEQVVGKGFGAVKDAFGVS